MSSFNARRFFLLAVCVSVFALSLLFAQLYSEEMPISYAALIVYVISVLIFIGISWKLTNKLFVPTTPGQENSAITTEELFSFTHDPATNLPTAQQAVKVFNQALKSPKRLAAITFKPVNFQHVNSLLGHHNSDLLLLQLESEIIATKRLKKNHFPHITCICETHSHQLYSVDLKII